MQKILAAILLFFATTGWSVSENMYVLFGPPRGSGKQSADYQLFRWNVPGGYKLEFEFSGPPDMENISVFEVGNSFIFTYQDHRHRLHYLTVERSTGRTTTDNFIANGTTAKGVRFCDTELLTVNNTTGELVLFDAISQTFTPVSQRGFVPRITDFYFTRPSLDKLLLWAPSAGVNDLYSISLDGNHGAQALQSWNLAPYVQQFKPRLKNGVLMYMNQIWLAEEAQSPGNTHLTHLNVIGTGPSRSPQTTFFAGTDFSFLGLDPTTVTMSLKHQLDLVEFDPAVNQVTGRTKAFDLAQYPGVNKNSEIYAIQLPLNDPNSLPYNRITVMNNNNSSPWAAYALPTGPTAPLTLPNQPQTLSGNSYNFNLGSPSGMAYPLSPIVPTSTPQPDPNTPEIAAIRALLIRIGKENATHITNGDIERLDSLKALDHLPLPGYEMLTKYGLRSVHQKLQADGQKDPFPVEEWAKDFGICSANTAAIGN